MTKNTEKGKKRRDKEKYPNLKKNLNIKARRDYIDTFYIDGVKDAKGNELIRALTEEEKEWLNDFYAGHVNASFCEKNRAYELIEEKERKKIRDKVKKLETKSKAIQTEMNKLTIKKNDLATKKKKIDDQIEELMKKDLKKQSYDANNARNRCLYNQAKKTGKLIKLNNKDYDDRTVKKLQGLDTEHIIMNEFDLDED